jgi:sulfite exporter TauE/SafE
VAAVARERLERGATALAVFGLGTAPALLGLSITDALVVRRRVAINRLSQAFVVAMGVSYLWRGLVVG